MWASGRWGRLLREGVITACAQTDMYIPAATLDDLLMRVFEKLLKSRNSVKPTRGETTELTGVLLKIRNPRARLSRTEMKGKLFSCLGELLWYLAKTDDLRFITYYLPRYDEESEDGQTVYGAYGPRLFDMQHRHDQVANVVSLLRKNQNSRRAVIQLFAAADIARTRKHAPCTCTLQFMIRHRRLHMFTNMRSNDAYWGLPHDVFTFTMLQEIIARTLGVELGTYKHAVGSLHLYDKQRQSALRYMGEGWQPTENMLQMPPMPLVDPWPSIAVLLKAESEIRRNTRVNIPGLKLDHYWKDLVRLLQIYRHYVNKDRKGIARIGKSMWSHVYNPYIERKRLTAKGEIETGPVQESLL